MIEFLIYLTAEVFTCSDVDWDAASPLENYALDEPCVLDG
jgi:hypothetical protein